MGISRGDNNGCDKYGIGQTSENLPLEELIASGAFDDIDVRIVTMTYEGGGRWDEDIDVDRCVDILVDYCERSGLSVSNINSLIGFSNGGPIMTKVETKLYKKYPDLNSITSVFLDSTVPMNYLSAVDRELWEERNSTVYCIDGPQHDCATLLQQLAACGVDVYRTRFEGAQFEGAHGKVSDTSWSWVVPFLAGR